MLNHVATEWEKPTLTEILVTDQFKCPETHETLVFERPFYGTLYGFIKNNNKFRKRPNLKGARNNRKMCVLIIYI